MKRFGPYKINSCGWSDCWGLILRYGKNSWSASYCRQPTILFTWNSSMVSDSFLNAVELPYPLPPWRHRFRTLSVFCEVDDNELAKRIPKPLRLSSNIVQFTVMHFESTVPTRPYYDSAVITQVEHKGKLGGNWLYGFTSTDQVLCGTREIWGYNMKLADIE